MLQGKIQLRLSSRLEAGLAEGKAGNLYSLYRCPKAIICSEPWDRHFVLES